MKNLINQLNIILVLISTVACNSNQSQPSAIHKNDIVLNQGQKWKVNPEMMVYIHQSETTAKEALHGDAIDYVLVGNTLTEQVKLLTKSCTMKGQSHDELHKWLHPYMLLVDSLSSANSTDEAHKLIIDINHSFEQFHIYFE